MTAVQTKGNIIQRNLLKKYMRQLGDLNRKKENLLRQRETIRAAFENPLRGISYTGMPHGGNISEGAATLSFKLADKDSEIEQVIEKQRDVLYHTLEFIDLLDKDSNEYDVLYARYIECLEWKDIPDVICLSSTPCYEYHKRGLDKLLEFSKVQKILEES